LAGFYGIVGSLHLLGWGLYLHYAGRYPHLVGLGFVAYMFGLRHAFDADHIAAVDDTVRFMLQKGRQPWASDFLLVGTFHRVLALAIGIAFARRRSSRVATVERHGCHYRRRRIRHFPVDHRNSQFVGVARYLENLAYGEVGDSQSCSSRGASAKSAVFSTGCSAERLQKLLSHSWHMYPLGLLFGLGFDTASEVGLLALTAGASAGNLPIPAVLCLPILFASGMAVMDTTDGVLMCKAYNWAFLNPLRKIFYNITTPVCRLPSRCWWGRSNFCRC